MLLDRRWNGQEGSIPTDHVKDAEPLKAVMKVKRKEMVPLVMVRMKRVEKIAVQYIMHEPVEIIILCDSLFQLGWPQ